MRFARGSPDSTQMDPAPSASEKLQKEIDAVQAELQEIQETHHQLQKEAAALGENDSTADLDATLFGLEADMKDLRQHLAQMKKLQRRANAPRAKRLPQMRAESGGQVPLRPKSRGMCSSSPRK